MKLPQQIQYLAAELLAMVDDSWRMQVNLFDNTAALVSRHDNLAFDSSGLLSLGPFYLSRAEDSDAAVSLSMSIEELNDIRSKIGVMNNLLVERAALRNVSVNPGILGAVEWLPRSPGTQVYYEIDAVSLDVQPKPKVRSADTVEHDESPAQP